MKKPLIIYGAGGLGREILSLIRTLPEWNILGFADDVVPAGKMISGLNLLGDRQYLNTLSREVYVVLAFGNPNIKSEVYAMISNPNILYPVVTHPSAVLQSETVKTGPGCVIGAGSILTTDIILGSHVLVNINTTIGHDSRVGDFCSLMPGVNVAGEVEIGARVLVGSGSNIINRARIGEGSTIGMGSVVIRDVSAGSVVAGVPAKPIRP